MEIFQVGIYVQRKPVHRHIMTALHTNGTDLSCLRSMGIEPHPRSTFQPAGLYTVIAADIYDALFHAVNVFLQPYAVLLYIEYRISHHLTGTVVGYIATPAYMKQFRPQSIQRTFIDKHITFVTGFPESIYMRVLAHHKHIVYVSSSEFQGYRIVKHFFLLCQCFTVLYNSPVNIFYIFVHCFSFLSDIFGYKDIQFYTNFNLRNKKR